MQARSAAFSLFYSKMDESAEWAERVLNQLFRRFRLNCVFHLIHLALVIIYLFVCLLFILIHSCNETADFTAQCKTDPFRPVAHSHD